MDFKGTRKTEITQSDVIRIITERVAHDEGVLPENVSVIIKMSQGDVGIKDPMDYSEYTPPHIKSVTILIHEDSC